MVGFGAVSGLAAPQVLFARNDLPVFMNRIQGKQVYVLGTKVSFILHLIAGHSTFTGTHMIRQALNNKLIKHTEPNIGATDSSS